MTRNESLTIDERLRLALTLSPPDRPDGVDMSPAAITGRLRDSCEMSTLCLALVELGKLAGAQR